MGKSRKKAIVKDVGHMKDVYRSSRKTPMPLSSWVVYRRTNKQILKNAVENGAEEIEFLQPKELVNDYDYVDIIWDFENINNKSPNGIKNQIKYRRK